MKISRRQLRNIINESINNLLIEEERLLDGPEVDLKYITTTYLTDAGVNYNTNYNSADLERDYPMLDYTTNWEDPEQPNFSFDRVLAVIPDCMPGSQTYRAVKKVVRRVNRQFVDEMVRLEKKPCHTSDSSTLQVCSTNPNTVYLISMEPWAPRANREV